MQGPVGRHTMITYLPPIFSSDQHVAFYHLTVYFESSQRSHFKVSWSLRFVAYNQLPNQIMSLFIQSKLKQ